jgi:hypothetical protein
VRARLSGWGRTLTPTQGHRRTQHPHGHRSSHRDRPSRARCIPRRRQGGRPAVASRSATGVRPSGASSTSLALTTASQRCSRARRYVARARRAHRVEIHASPSIRSCTHCTIITRAHAFGRCEKRVGRLPNGNANAPSSWTPCRTRDNRVRHVPLAWAQTPDWLPFLLPSCSADDTERSGRAALAFHCAAILLPPRPPRRPTSEGLCTARARLAFSASVQQERPSPTTSKVLSAILTAPSALPSPLSSSAREATALNASLWGPHRPVGGSMGASCRCVHDY